MTVTGFGPTSERSMATQPVFVPHGSPSPRTSPSGSWVLPTVLSITAGAVDVIGFLALGGLFTAHITGNVVTLAAHYVIGGFSQVGPLLAVPVFVAVLGVLALVFGAVAEVSGSRRRALLILHLALLAACLGLAVASGPFADADGPSAVLVGMLAVAAMATQNALVRLALPHVPSTVVMTTNITQLIIDLARLVRNERELDDVAAARRRAGVTFSCVVGFVCGAAIGAVLEVHYGLRALAFPVGLAAVAVLLGERRRQMP
jgi:uncharacterized membrane protein YoaK (UPF0700 family)